jgi:proline iminopeptidase
LYCERLGDPDAPALLSLHGGPGISDHSKGKEAFEPLTDDYQLVVYDHRGCGRSELALPYSNEQYAADAEALRTELDLGEVVLIGGSYGGFVTQQYAINHPEHLTGFVLRDTAATSEYEDNAWENAREKWPDLQSMDLGVPEITWEEFSRVMDGDVRSDEEFERCTRRHWRRSTRPPPRRPRRRPPPGTSTTRPTTRCSPRRTRRWTTGTTSPGSRPPRW